MSKKHILKLRNKCKGDPLCQDIDGWYFWDETWTTVYGPYKTEKEAEEALRDYAEREGFNT